MRKTYLDKVQNMFSAYVLRTVEGKRKKYLYRQNRVRIAEEFWEECPGVEPAIYFDEFYHSYQKEKLLEREVHGIYPDITELSDYNLSIALRKLHKDELQLIFEHVFHEKSFLQMAEETGIPQNKLEHRYYYAIRKVRNWIGEH